MSCITCNLSSNIILQSDSKLSTNRLIVSNGVGAQVFSVGKLSASAGIFRNTSQSLFSESNFSANENADFNPKQELEDSAVGNIFARTQAIMRLNDRCSSNSVFYSGKTDKFSGSKLSFQPTAKLYPIADISFKNKFTNNDISMLSYNYTSNDIYSNVDEGVFVGAYTENNKNGALIADDSRTLIFPSQVFNSGDLQYKFRVNYPLANPYLSYFAIRAYARFDNYIFRRPQSYRIYDITLEDPSGNLITKYNDINVKGDNYFTTYISHPSINNVQQPTWSSGFPYMDSGAPLFLENKPYTLTLNFAYECQSGPFDNRFDFGYQQLCISGSDTQFDNPNAFNTLLISAIEIGSSGGVGIKKDNHINCYTMVRSRSERTKRILLPNQLLTHTYNNGIYPEASSVWRTPDYEYSNQSDSDSRILLQKLRNPNTTDGDFISLSGSAPYVDSGRLILKFNTDRPRDIVYTDGAFNFGGNKTFDDSVRRQYQYEDYFDVDYAELRVIARKLNAHNDYPLDIVGYSDDKLFYVTSPVGGFLQNSGALPINESMVPDVSGFKKLNAGISTSSMSDSSEYFLRDESPLGDHYILNTSVLVNSTDFKEYIVPLDIYQDPSKLGYERYSLSSYFENLYIDICPIPSGASIAHVSLILYYKPSNALHLHILGSPTGRSAVQKYITLFPDGSGTINSLQQPTGVVIGFSSPSHLSTNFSRRWRGYTGDIIVGGDFVRSEFDFSFNHQQSDALFLNSYVDFTNHNGINFYDHNGDLAGYSVGNDLNVLSNFGWRYSSNQLIGGLTTPYTSISWNANIYDNFDRALRLDSDYIYFAPLNRIDHSFVFFFRYSPDKVLTSELNNHLILCCEDSSYAPIMVVVVEDGNIKVKVKNKNGSESVITDSSTISQYSFPIPILITYNDVTDTLKLYTDNMLVPNFNRLRASGSANPIDTNVSTYFRYATDYFAQFSIPMFLHEIGYSSGCHIVDSNPNRFANQITTTDLFDSYNVSSSLIDDNISEWSLGDFKICSFSPDFNFYTKREGIDYITFSINHVGSGYTQLTNKILPNDINLSGVSYHTQIENDFLRFAISDIPSIDSERFYGVGPRISKNLPKGYSFRENAICVNTILEHHTYDNIKWSNGKIGPKLIVSLYAPTQNPTDLPSEEWGLVNRSIHYLEPSGCIRKITSNFKFNDLMDMSEPWASFDKKAYYNEFDNKYLSDDIHQMFLQYDLIYPSGSSYSSQIKIHSANINFENAIFFNAHSSGIIPLYNSGEYYQFACLNLFAPINGPDVNSSPPLNLVASGHVPTPLNNSINLYVDNLSSGYFVPPESCQLYTIANGSVNSDPSQFFSNVFGSSPLTGLNLSISGQLMNEDTVPLHTIGFAYDTKNSLHLINIGDFGSIVIDQRLGLRTLASIDPNYFTAAYMSLYANNSDIITNTVGKSFNLYLSGFNPNVNTIQNSLQLVTLNYPISESLITSSATIKWDGNNVGTGITSIDNAYAYVDADDNIRGVNLACYGDCEQ